VATAELHEISADAARAVGLRDLWRKVHQRSIATPAKTQGQSCAGSRCFLKSGVGNCHNP